MISCTDETSIVRFEGLQAANWAGLGARSRPAKAIELRSLIAHFLVLKSCSSGVHPHHASGWQL